MGRLEGLSQLKNPMTSSLMSERLLYKRCTGKGMILFSLLSQGYFKMLRKQQIMKSQRDSKGGFHITKREYQSFLHEVKSLGFHS
jgi:hypothetical protein